VGLPESAIPQLLIDATAAARIGVMVTDRVGEELRTLYVSPVALELLRATPADLLNTDAARLVSDQKRPQVLGISAAIRSGQPVEMPFEMDLQRADGTMLPVELAVTPVEVDGRTHMVSFFWSVESRRAAQDRARQVHAQYRGLIEAAPDGVVVSREGKVLWANEAAAKLLGVPRPQDMVGMDLGERLIHSEDLEVMKERLAKMREQGARYEPREYRARRKDGREVVAEVRSIPFQWEGQPAVMAIVRDVTERATLQTRLAQTDRLSSLGTLAAGVAHEINNPMAAILFGIEGVERMLKRPALDEKARADMLGLLGDLRKGAERVTRIVRDLRVFSRGGDESVGPVDLLQVVEAAVRIAGHSVRAKASLQLDLGTPPAVKGNLARLEQVMVNLLINAAQAMPEHREVMLNRVSVMTRLEGNHVVVEVTDNGQGISKEALPHIFEPFFTTKPVDIGTGLGLSICHGIVGQLGGELTVASTSEDGTTLAMKLVRADR
jgi:PAS domain S-box-containing protein